jgi:tRNA A-37 threonylcarbamoyl transferase component Bud32
MADERSDAFARSRPFAHEAEWIAPKPSVRSRSTEFLTLVRQQEHHLNVAQLRLGASVGVVMWCVYLLLDWLIDATMKPGSFAALLLIRSASVAIPVGCTARLWSKRLPSPRMLAWLDAGVYVSGGVGIALMSIVLEGLRSYYFPGLMLVILCRGAVVIQPWRRSLFMVGSIAVAYFTVLLVGVASSEYRWQLHDRAALGQLGVHFAYAIGTGAMVIIYAHRAWGLRRKVFEQRAVGRYRLLKLLGSGAYGEVWTAHHEGLHREVAVKILHVARGFQLDAVRRFEREVEMTASLTHPNTVRVFDYGVTEEGIWYYAMEKLEGVNLAQLVAVEGTLPTERVVHLMLQASDALAEAHARGIVHRDVKPENLFVAWAGGTYDFVKLLDFGMAKLRYHEDASALTHPGGVLGTPAYLPPELGMGKTADARSDIYSLGATFYFALTGSPPFRGTSPVQLLMQHVSDEVEPPSQRLGATIEGDVEAVILRCLAKDPAARFATAGELHEALQRCSCSGTWTATIARLEPAAARLSRADPSRSTWRALE